jgi:glutathione S-transferase
MVAKNPTMKIPMLEDDGEVIFDSRVIYRYLNDKFAYPSLSWEKENQLTLIDAANDSFVELLLLQRSGLDTSEDKMFFNLQRQRVKTTLTHLDALAGKGYFKDWNYPSICLYCLVDWVAFRELHDLSSLVNLLDIVSTNSNRPEVVNTDPR